MHVAFWWETRRKEATKKTKTWGEDIIKIYLRNVGCGGMDWIQLSQYRGPVEVSCEHCNKPSSFKTDWEILE
jgi:hypothetical protein